MNPIEAIAQHVFESEMGNVFTSLPATVLEYDETSQQVKAKIAISLDGQDDVILTGVPVQFFAAKNYLCTVQIDAGTEGTIEFYMRDVSQWLHGEAEQSKRRFDINDARFVVGVRSEANAIPDLENNGIQLRNLDGKQYIWLKNDGDSYISGNLFVAKEIKAQGDIYSKGEVVTRISHNHKYIDSVGSGATPTTKTTEQAEQ